MKALVLAAGYGRRLWPLTASRPKCLLSFGGTTILAHQLDALQRMAVDEVVIVCGHAAQRVYGELDGAHPSMSLRILFSPFYPIADNLVSLWVAREELDDDVILLNGDAVFPLRTLQLLEGISSPCCLLVARKPAYSRDDMKVHLQGGRVANIGKDLAEEHIQAAAIGVARFSFPAALELRRELDRGLSDSPRLRCHFPRMIQRMIDHGERVTAVDIGDLPWADVDTPADLQYVRKNSCIFRDFLPGKGDGP